MGQVGPWQPGEGADGPVNSVSQPDPPAGLSKRERERGDGREMAPWPVRPGEVEAVVRGARGGGSLEISSGWPSDHLLRWREYRKEEGCMGIRFLSIAQARG